MTTAKNGVALTQATQEMYKNDSTAFDRELAYQKAIGAYLGEVGGLAGSPVSKVSSAYGVMVASEGLLYNLGMEIGALAYVMKSSISGGDPQVFQEALDEAADRNKQVFSNAIDFELSAADLVTPTGSIGTFIKKIVDSDAGKVALQSLDLLHTGYDCAAASCMSHTEMTSQQAAGELQGQFSSPTEGFAEVDGTAVVSNSAGSFLAAQSGLDIQGVDGGDITTLADPSGNYDVFIPLQAPNTNYSNLDVSVFDPISDDVLATETVNLSTATTTTPITIGTLTGSCNDSDATNPDDDDPDCD